MGAFESGQAFLQQVLAKLPEDKRAAAKALFEDAGAKDAVTLAGDGVLARADYSKAMDELRAKGEELDTWFHDNKAAVDDYLAIKPKYDELTRTTPPPKPADPPPPDPRQVALDLLNEQGPHYLQASAWLAAKALEHKDLFGERLDVMALVSDPRLGKQIKGQPEGRVVSLPDLYQEKYGEKVTAKEKEVTEAKFNEEVDRRIKARDAGQVRNPYPLRGEASVLDALTDEGGPAKHTIDSAVALYDSLQQART